MSYDVYFEIDTGGGNVVTIDDRNYTSNVSPMWSKALALPEKPWVRDGDQVMGHRPNGDGTWTTSPAMNHGVRLLHDAPASECAGILAAAVERMTSNPGEYRSMNPDNGWGCYEGALEFLRWMADMAAAHPRSVIRVSS
jgi:hypothetical protein